MKVEIQHFKGGTLPSLFATVQGGGRNVSPGVRWSAVSGAKSYSLLFDDLHPMAKGWVHWKVEGIPATITEIEEGASRTAKMPKGSLEMATSWGRAGYDGPQPPKGSGPHEYVMHVYAHDEKGHVIEEGKISGIFER